MLYSTERFNRTIHFDQPFRLSGVDETIVPATTIQVPIEGHSWLAYRDVATFIKLPVTVENRHGRRMIPIEPDELARLFALGGAGISDAPRQEIDADGIYPSKP